MIPFSHVGLFAGIGAFDLGFGERYTTTFANDHDATKASCYAANHGRGALHVGDIAGVTADDIPGRPDVMSVGFPCVDISEAGKRAGIRGERSGVFWEFVRILGDLNGQGRAPRVVVVENVSALLGNGFDAVVGALKGCGYRRLGATVVDAAHFRPQSRLRVFIIAVHGDLKIPAGLEAAAPVSAFTPAALVKAVASLPGELASTWINWALPVPPASNVRLVDILEADAVWDAPARSALLVSQLSAISKAEISKAQAHGATAAFAAFRRKRPVVGSQFEIRTDGIAGCLRTASGGSSRQALFAVDRGEIRTRLLSPREAARLQGLPDTFRLPPNLNAALTACGDAVCVPVVAHLAKHLVTPILAQTKE